MTIDQKKMARALNDDAAPKCEDIRNSLSAAALKQAVLDHLIYSVGRILEITPEKSYYKALALIVRDRLQHRWINTTQTYLANAHMESGVRIACYFSAEFLMGPQFGSSLVNLGIEQEVREAVAGLGKDLDDLITLEEEPGLGNGGLGRLAACYLDSLATLEIPAIGYDIRYEFGIFDQEIRDGWQIEITDLWLHNGNPWEIAKPDVAYYVNFGGHCESYHDNQGYSRNLCQHDPFLVLADYADYVACQDKVTAVWQDQEQWTRMSILNTARAGKFSSDRAIREYCDEIWKVRAVAVELPSNERDL